MSVVVWCSVGNVTVNANWTRTSDHYLIRVNLKETNNSVNTLLKVGCVIFRPFSLLQQHPHWFNPTKQTSLSLLMPNRFMITDTGLAQHLHASFVLGKTTLFPVAAACLIFGL